MTMHPPESIVRQSMTHAPQSADSIVRCIEAGHVRQSLQFEVEGIACDR
ncbi:MAG: hypothetical protein NTU56_11420 [Proteobacteria bacterium]|nr:hypothetical protein [Pseudomonadota bacterium]